MTKAVDISEQGRDILFRLIYAMLTKVLTLAPAEIKMGEPDGITKEGEPVYTYFTITSANDTVLRVSVTVDQPGFINEDGQT